MKRFLPSLSALRAFEAAARHGSFTRAANELNMTQTAISHQIKALEEQLGALLFVRHRNTLKLTQTAQSYLPQIRSAIHLLAEATETVIQTEQDTVLTVNSLATFCVRALIPALADFRLAHPDIRLRLSASASYDEFDRKAADVSIRIGHGSWPGMRADKIRARIVYPVCSPDFMSAPSGLREPPDLAEHVIVRTGFSFFFEDAWPVWLSAAGLADMPIKSPLVFEYALPALEAAVRGLGVALAQDPLVDEDVANGRLVRPFDVSADTGESYFVVSSVEVASRPKVRAFREWLLQRFAR